MLDTQKEGLDKEMEGVVLLDLPDHDSTEVAHHLEVDRLVALADLLIWVLDPQKYADAAIHDRYLAPFASHAGVMVVVLNQIDTVPADRRQAMVDDVRRLLDAEGLAEVPVFAASARHGDGVAELRAEIVRRVADKKSTRQRLEADLRAVAARLNEECGSGKPRSLAKQRVESMEDALADAAGVPTVVAAIERSTRMRAGQATGWPMVSWASRLRPDPLKRLHLDLGAAGKQLTSRNRTSMPEATPVQRARVDSEVRELADDVSAGMSRPWAEALRRASLSRLPEVTDRLDLAIAETDLGVAKLPIWANLVRLLQWALIITALVGWGLDRGRSRFGGPRQRRRAALRRHRAAAAPAPRGRWTGHPAGVVLPAPGGRDRQDPGRGGRPEAARRRPRGLGRVGGGPDRGRAGRLPHGPQRAHHSAEVATHRPQRG